MLHIILGILTILLTILKWLGILLLILLLLAVALVLIVLFVPVRYRGRGEKTAEKLGAELSVTWLLHLIVVEAVFDAEGGSLKIRIFGRTPEEWRAPAGQGEAKEAQKGKSRVFRGWRKETKKYCKRREAYTGRAPGKNRAEWAEFWGETGNFAGHKFSWNGSIQACENPDVRAKFCR